ncbi:hypothetical protein Y032_0648g1111 [Ancylostoma ceylanicum]|uniref:Secreted protein n=1 Tax=Ancylostoma ceylanicum TaxID=53326 RepID=A0A016WKU6_9BILA|nr:hypothetical protein Y032_0648g1111 [Ancylostoma ceylanicum]
MLSCLPIISSLLFIASRLCGRTAAVVASAATATAPAQLAEPAKSGDSLTEDDQPSGLRRRDREGDCKLRQSWR